MRVLIVDDHEIVRRGVRSLLSAHGGIEVCGEAVDGQDAVAKALGLKPDVITMDISMPNLNGLEATREISRILPQIPIVILSQHDTPEMMRQAEKAGARGYVVKSAISTALVTALDRVGRGELSFDWAGSQNSQANLDTQEIIQRSEAFEKALRESEERLRMAMDAGRLGVWDWDIPRNHVTWTDRIYEFHGLERGAFDGTVEAFAKLIHPEDKDMVQRALEDALTRRTPYEIEFRTIRPSGEVRWLFTRAEVFPRQIGSPARMIGITQDVTARMSAMKTLERSSLELAERREFFRVTLSSIGDAVITTDTEAKITYLNPVAEAMTGWKSNEALGQPLEKIFNIINEEDRNQAPSPVTKALREGAVAGLANHTALIGRDGSETAIADSAAPIRDAAGNISGVMIVFHDVTEQRKAEDALRESNPARRLAEMVTLDSGYNKSLQLSEGRFRALAESASEAIITIDPQSTILFVNRAAEGIFGYSVDEMMGHKITMLMPEYLRHVHEAAIRNYTETGNRHINWTAVELPGLHKSGREVPIELSIAEHMDAGQKRFTGILRDISERKKSEQATKRQTAVIQLLQKVAIAANEARTVEDAFAEALSLVCRHTGAGLGHVYFANTALPRKLVPSSLWHVEDQENYDNFRELTQATVLQPGIGLPGRVISTAGPVWMTDVRADSYFIRKEPSKLGKIVSAFAFPVSIKGEIVAILEFFSVNSEPGDEQLLEALASIGAQLGRVVERKRVEESLRSLSAHLLRSQDEERRRIGRELHDSVGQYLVAMQMNLNSLRIGIPQSDSTARHHISESIELIKRCSTEIRTLSYLLHPPHLEEVGLVSTISWYVDGFSKRSGIVVAVDIAGDLGRCSPDVELALFRVLQESLTNIHRHSGTKSARVRMYMNEKDLILEIADQGSGIKIAGTSAQSSMNSGVGIAGMTERLAELGGNLVVSSNSDGTIVKAVIPFERCEPDMRATLP